MEPPELEIEQTRLLIIYRCPVAGCNVTFGDWEGEMEEVTYHYREHYFDHHGAADDEAELPETDQEI